MNIVFVYRKKIQGRYSLENVFNSLIPYLKKKHNIRIYYTRGHKFLFQDIFHLRSLKADIYHICLLYTSPSPRDRTRSRMPSSA